ncbi:MAG TPA: diguanylate cyclase [Candidatus Eremiobacteraceae bacterium]|nr:diguanylate cyclase [Candidatus Eremiobacteraceae bacterium]
MNQTNSKYQVLVVDDSPVYRKLVEQVLASASYELLFAANGTEALKMYEQHSPCMVIADWMLPDFSGLELCQRIRSDATRPYAYIIIMTSNSQKEDVVKGLQAGADDYLTKPFDSGEMVARVGVGKRIIDLNRELAAKSERLEEAARTDPLTGLPNRRAIEEWAWKQLRGAVRHKFCLWVVLGDLDSFKTVNDTFGHDAGDIVLRTFGDVLKRNTRACDICGRLGGDEFVLVLTHVEPGAIDETVNRFREQFAALSFPLQGRSVQVTASFGVAGSDGNDMQDFGTLLRKADQMLYEAKRAGRNLVRVSFSPSPEL